MVRALASHQCGLGSIPSVDAICRLSLVLVLVPVLRDFLWLLRFFSFQKTNISKFQFDLETMDERATLWKPLKLPFIYFYFLLWSTLRASLKDC